MTKEQEAIKELKDNGFTVVKMTRQNGGIKSVGFIRLNKLK